MAQNESVASNPSHSEKEEDCVVTGYMPLTWLLKWALGSLSKSKLSARPSPDQRERLEIYWMQNGDRVKDFDRLGTWRQWYAAFPTVFQRMEVAEAENNYLNDVRKEPPNYESDTEIESE